MDSEVKRAKNIDNSKSLVMLQWYVPQYSKGLVLEFAPLHNDQHTCLAGIMQWSNLPMALHTSIPTCAHTLLNTQLGGFNLYSSLYKETNSRTHLWNTLLSTYVRYLRRVVKSLWQDYNLVEELPGHPVVPSLLLSTFLFITPVHLKLLGSSKTLGAQLNSAKRQID